MTDAVSCPTCREPVPSPRGDIPASFPFCSERCRSGDLGAWIDGRYLVPGESLEAVAERQAMVDRDAP